MGMFDTIVCYYSEMPEEHRGVEFQTKSLYSCMEEYKIDENGILWIEDFGIEEMPNNNYDPDKTFSFKTITRKINTRWIEFRKFTKTINMYTTINSKWVEYSITYENGIVTNLKHLPN